jgi:hypothetical protein
MPNSLAYGVTAAHMSAVWRDGKDLSPSRRLPGSNSERPRPSVGRARPTPHFKTSEETRVKPAASNAATPVSERRGRDSSKANTPESPSAATGSALPSFTVFFSQSASALRSAASKAGLSSAAELNTIAAPVRIACVQPISPAACRVPKRSSPTKSGQRRSPPSEGS